jgi:hypothetical protein
MHLWLCWHTLPVAHHCLLPPCDQGVRQLDAKMPRFNVRTCTSHFCATYVATSNRVCFLQDAVSFVLEGLAKGQAPQDVAASMLDACLATDPKDACGIGCDNMTCVIIRLNSADMS